VRPGAGLYSSFHHQMCLCVKCEMAKWGACLVPGVPVCFSALRNESMQIMDMWNFPYQLIFPRGQQNRRTPCAACAHRSFTTHPRMAAARRKTFPEPALPYIHQNPPSLDHTNTSSKEQKTPVHIQFDITQVDLW
jgi:hypothetical protein